MRIVTGIVLAFTFTILLCMSLVFLFLAIHPIGDLGISPVSSVDIPDSQYSVCVYGPNSDGHYHYTIYADNYRRSYGSINLGAAIVNESFEPTILEISPEVYRINWGEGENAAYAITDVKRGLIIEDSNPDNERNFRFLSER